MGRDLSELQLEAHSGGPAEWTVEAAERGGGLTGLGEESESVSSPGFEGEKTRPS